MVSVASDEKSDEDPICTPVCISVSGQTFPLQEEVIPISTLLNITFDVKREFVEGSTWVELNVTKEIRSIRVSAADMAWDLFSAVVYDEESRVYPISNYHIDEAMQLVELKLMNPIPAQRYRLYMEFGSKLRKDLMGCYLTYRNDSEGVGHPFVISQFEPNYARTCFPTFDEPRVKMPFRITVTAPSELIILSNTDSVRVFLSMDFQVSTRIIDGSEPMKEVTFAPTPKMAAYLVAFGIGPFASLSALTSTNVTVETFYPRCLGFHSLEPRVQRI